MNKNIRAYGEKRRKQEKNTKDGAPEFVYLVNYYYGYQTNDDEMSGAKQQSCGRYDLKTKVYSKNQTTRYDLEDSEADDRMMIKYVLKTG
jgi:hypothetical protein